VRRVFFVFRKGISPEMTEEITAFYQTYILPYLNYAVAVYVAVLIVMFAMMERCVMKGLGVEKPMKRLFTVWGVGIAVLLVLYFLTEFGASRLFFY